MSALVISPFAFANILLCNISGQIALMGHDGSSCHIASKKSGQSSKKIQKQVDTVNSMMMSIDYRIRMDEVMLADR
jgi:hypothetical protein